MNKYYNLSMIFLLGTLALTACQQEERGDDIETPGKGEIGFYLSGPKATKAPTSVTRKGAEIVLEGEEAGSEFYLEEYITNLDAIPADGPVTKGTPVYTSNFYDLSNGKFNSTVYGANGAFAENVEFAYDGTKYYRKIFDGALWDNKPLYFYMWMPGTLGADICGSDGNTATGAAALEFDAGKISFHYDGSKLSSSTGDAKDVTAQQMKDLVFTSRYFTDKNGTANDFNSYNEKTGAPLLFHHALTGVKFATSNHISHEENGTKTIIDKVTFKGLKDIGDCEITPVGSEANPTSPYVLDNITTYSSASCVVWTNPSASGATYSQQFTEDNFVFNPYSSHFDYETEGETNDGFFPDSFYGNDAAWTGTGTHRTTDWNMNDEDATMTFWFMPQQLDASVELEVTFHIVYHTSSTSGVQEWTGQPITRTIKFGDMTRTQTTGTNGSVTYGNYADWKAGELRTYVLKAQQVDVEITDDLNAGVKENLQITNVGNVPEYVRATIIAYWADADGNAVFGYTGSSVRTNASTGAYELVDNPSYVEPWTLDKEKLGWGSGALYGDMDLFYPEAAAYKDDWVIGNDGYYYYIGGDQNGVLGVDQSSTEVLFGSYEVKSIPEIWQIDQKTLGLKKVTGVKLVMEVLCQAVIAKQASNGGFVPWNDAWEEALDYDPSL